MPPADLRRYSAPFHQGSLGRNQSLMLTLTFSTPFNFVTHHLTLRYSTPWASIIVLVSLEPCPRFLQPGHLYQCAVQSSSTATQSKAVFPVGAHREATVTHSRPPPALQWSSPANHWHFAWMLFHFEFSHNSAWEQFKTALLHLAADVPSK